MSATYQIRRSDAGHIIHAGVEFANLGEFMAAKFGGTASDYGYTTTLKPTIESETIMDAIETLKAAIREHGNADAVETTEWTETDFINAWSHEIDRLESDGDCEIPSRFTRSGHPVVVTA